MQGIECFKMKSPLMVSGGFSFIPCRPSLHKVMRPVVGINMIHLFHRITAELTNTNAGLPSRWFKHPVMNTGTYHSYPFQCFLIGSEYTQIVVSIAHARMPRNIMYMGVSVNRAMIAQKRSSTMWTAENARKASQKPL